MIHLNIIRNDYKNQIIQQYLSQLDIKEYIKINKSTFYDFKLKIKDIKQFRINITYFNSSLFDNDDFINLKRLFKKKNAKIYDLSNLQSANYSNQNHKECHKHIDHTRNILSVFVLNNNIKLGFYTNLCFKSSNQGITHKEDTFIFNLNDVKSFDAKENQGIVLLENSCLTVYGLGLFREKFISLPQNNVYHGIKKNRDLLGFDYESGQISWQQVNVFHISISDLN